MEKEGFRRAVATCLQGDPAALRENASHFEDRGRAIGEKN
jgi:hypothetical protein